MPRTSRSRRPRHIHLGERLTVIERIRRGRHTPEEAAARAGVPIAEVMRWLEVHGDDRIVGIDEVSEPEEQRRLAQRAQLLVDMIENADQTIRSLVRQLAERLRSERVPADVIWLDIDFQDRNRPFSTNQKTFPNLKGLAHDVGTRGFKLVAITDLHIAHAPDQGYTPYDSGVSGDHFLKNPDGSIYVAPVWPGPSVFPDFTRKSSREWWGSLYKPFLAQDVRNMLQALLLHGSAERAKSVGQV